MIEIAIVSGKGGVGKSVVAASLAAFLACRGYDVLLVDADGEAPSSTYMLYEVEWFYSIEAGDSYIIEIDYERCTACGKCVEACSRRAIELKNGKPIVSVARCEGCPTCSIVCPTKAISRRRVPTGRISVGLSKLWISTILAEVVPGRSGTGKLIYEAKTVARSIAGRNTLIVVDGAAGTGCRAIAALAGSNIALLITEPTPAALSDLERLYRVVEEFRIPTALIVNKCDIGVSKQQVLEFAQSKGIVVLGEVPYDESVQFALAKSLPPVVAYPDSAASQALEKIFEKLLDLAKI